MDLIIKNDVERIETMKLTRKILLISPFHFDIAIVRSLVSLANGGIEDKDRMLRVCLATLSEIGMFHSLFLHFVLKFLNIICFLSSNYVSFLHNI